MSRLTKSVLALLVALVLSGPVMAVSADQHSKRQDQEDPGGLAIDCLPPIQEGLSASRALINEDFGPAERFLERARDCYEKIAGDLSDKAESAADIVRGMGKKVTKKEIGRVRGVIGELRSRILQAAARSSYMLGILAVSRSDSDGAIRHLEQAVKFDPTNQEYKEALEDLKNPPPSLPPVSTDNALDV